MKHVRLICLLLALALLSGCAQTLIREDTTRERLPHINPALGMESSEQVTLYMLLAGESLLAPVYRSLRISQRDNPAALVVDALLAGPQELETHVENMFPAGTEALDVVRRGDTVEVVLSREFLRTNMLGSREDNLHRQKLCVYAVVNSLCALDGVESVQLLVDTDGSGIGTQVPPFLLGFSEGELATQVVGPLKRDTAFIATPQALATLALTHLQGGEYLRAQRLLSAADGEELPTLAMLEEVFSREILLDEFAVKGFAIKDSGNNELTLDLSWRDSTGTLHRQEGLVVQTRAEQGLQKMDYHSLYQAVLNGEEAI